MLGSNGKKSSKSKDASEPGKSKEPKKRVLHGYKLYTFGKRGKNVKSVKDLGKRNYRRDGKSKRQYAYVRWDATEAIRGRAHITHVNVKYKNIILQQKVPGYCMLCPQKAYFTRNQLMENHYSKVHFKDSIVFGKIRLLKCKCSEVPNRGTDDSTRNAHYHCLDCHKPCDKKSQLATHMICKHDYDPDNLADLFEIPKRKK